MPWPAWGPLRSHGTLQGCALLCRVVRLKEVRLPGISTQVVLAVTAFDASEDGLPPGLCFLTICNCKTEPSSDMDDDPGPNIFGLTQNPPANSVSSTPLFDFVPLEHPSHFPLLSDRAWNTCPRQSRPAQNSSRS